MPVKSTLLSASRKILLSPLTWLAAALALRLAYLAGQQTGSVLFYQPLLDEEEMVRAARQLLAGGGFGPEPLFKAPLYPMWLATVIWVSGAGWFFTARLAQHLLGGLLVLLAWDTARRVAGGGRRGRWAGAAAAAALALYGPLIRLEDCLILDFFSVFLQSAMLWALVRLHGSAGILACPSAQGTRIRHEVRWAALAGSAAAAAWLNRPTLTPVLPLLALWICWERGRPRPLPRSNVKDASGLQPPASSRIPHSAFRIPHFFSGLFLAAVFLAFPLLAMAAVYIRNARAGGEAMILPWQGGYNFYFANGLKANGKYLVQEGYSLARTGNPTRELAESAATGTADAPVRSPWYFHAIDRYWMSRARAEIAADPARWLGLLGRKLLYLATAREIYNFEDYDVQRSLSPILRRLPLSFGVLWPLALAGAALAWRVGRSRRRQRHRLFLLLWLYLLALGGAIGLYYVSGRLRMPLVFPAAVLAAIALADSGQLIFALRIFSPFKSAFRNPHSAIFFILFLLGCAMSWGDWWGVRSENLRHLEYARLSNAAWRDGQYARALDYAAASQRERPGYPAGPLLRGQALYSLGRIDEAAPEFQASLALLPEDAVAAYNLGIIAYYDRPDPPRAAEMFEEALRRQPAYAQAAWMGALAHLRQGRPDRARQLLRPCLPPGANAPEKLLIAAAALALAEGDAPAARRHAETLQRATGPAALDRLKKELNLLGISF